MKFDLFEKLKSMPIFTKAVWILLILFLVGLLLAYLTGYLNQVVVVAGNAAFLIFAALFFVLILMVFLGILGIKLKS